MLTISKCFAAAKLRNKLPIMPILTITRHHMLPLKKEVREIVIEKASWIEPVCENGIAIP